MLPDLRNRIPRAWLGHGALAFVALATALLVLSTGAQAVPTGGPDASPQLYRWKDSTAAGCPAGPQCPDPTWLEHAATYMNPPAACDAAAWGSTKMVCGTCPVGDTSGCPPNSLNDEEWSAACEPIGFSFTYYGTPNTCVWVHSNGALCPSSGPACPGDFTAFIDVPFDPIPDTAAPNLIIAGFGADIAPNYCGQSFATAGAYSGGRHSSVWAGTTGASPNRVFTVEYNGLYVWDYTSPVSGCGEGDGCVGGFCGYADFQIKLYETTNNIDVVVRQVDINPGSLATPNDAIMGIEDATGTNGLQYAMHPGTAAYSLSSISVRYYPNHGPICGTQDVALDEDAGATGFTMTATDPDGDAMTGFKVTGTGPTHAGVWNPPVGTLTPGGPYPEAGWGAASRTYTAGANWNSDPVLGTPESITYQSQDALGFASTSSLPLGAPCNVQFKVTPVNDAPTFTASGPATVSANAGVYKTLAAWATGVSAGPSDAKDEQGTAGASYGGGQKVQFELQPHWIGGPISLTNWPNSVFSSLPSLVRTPSLTSGSNADLSFVGATGGTYRACYRAVDDGGTSSGGVDKSVNTECIDITIVGGTGGPTTGCGVPVADFLMGGTDGLKIGQTVSFKDASTITGGASLVKWAWDFGDGAISSEKDPAHTFGAPGAFNVRLVVTDSGGCQSFKDMVLEIGYGTAAVGLGGGSGVPACYAGENQVVREAQDVVLRGSVNGLASEDVLFTWKQVRGADVPVAGVDTSEVRFQAPKLADVESPEYLIFALRVSQKEGGAGSLDCHVQVTVTPANRKPIADAGLDQTVTRGTPFQLDGAASSDPDGLQGLTYQWSRLAGAEVAGLPATGAKVPLTAPTGTDTFVDVQLVVSDGTFSSADTVRIWLVAPETALTFEAKRLGDDRFLFVANKACADCQWDFGDGTTAQGNGVTHRYATPGSYDVTLRSGGSPVVQPVQAVAPDQDALAADGEASSGGLAWLWFAIAGAVVLAGAAVGFALWHRNRAKPE